MDAKKKKVKGHDSEKPLEFDQKKIRKKTDSLKGHLNETIPKPSVIPKHPKLKNEFSLKNWEKLKMKYTTKRVNLYKDSGGTFLKKSYSEMTMKELKTEREKLTKKVQKIEKEIESRK
jgi:chaperonin cofactor prefoldin